MQAALKNLPNKQSKSARGNSTASSGRIGRAAGKRQKKNFVLKIRGTMFNGLNVIPTDPTRDPPPRVCYNCWQKGHSLRDCPRPIVAKYCKNCGRRGEDMTSCPRCKDAYERYAAQAKAQSREFEEFISHEQLDKFAPKQVYDDDEVEVDRESYGNGSAEVLSYSDREREREIRDRDRDREYEREREERQREREMQRERERQRESDRQREREVVENSYKGTEDRRSYRESPPRYADEIDRYYKRDRWERTEREQNDEWRERGDWKERQESDDWKEREERERSRWRMDDEKNSTTMASGANITSDPVQDILLLAKTIAHLSPDTQDLIMRQVIAERKEHHARIKAMQEREEDTWP